MFKLLEYLKSLKFITLPVINGKYFVYRKDDWKTEFHFEIDVSEVEEDNDIKLYGWVVDMKDKTGKKWTNHWNHKLYCSKGAAIDAVNQFRGSPYGYYRDYEFRIVAMYDFQNNGFRNHIINKILKEENI